jgi:hypothetical protein
MTATRVTARRQARFNLAKYIFARSPRWERSALVLLLGFAGAPALALATHAAEYRPLVRRGEARRKTAPFDIRDATLGALLRAAAFSSRWTARQRRDRFSSPSAYHVRLQLIAQRRVPPPRP